MQQTFFCCKIKAVLSSYSLYRVHIHVHTEHGNTWTYGFLYHTLPSVTTRGDAHTLCVLSHIDTCRSDCSSLSDPFRQRSWQAAILVRSAVIALSRRPSLLATIALLETHALVFWHCLHPCRPPALSPFKFTQQSTSLLSCLVGKTICRVILFESVILFKKSTVIPPER